MVEDDGTLGITGGRSGGGADGFVGAEVEVDVDEGADRDLTFFGLRDL